MDKKKWMLLSVAAVLLIALVLGILALLGVFGPYKVGLCLPRTDSLWSDYYGALEDKLLQANYQVERCTVNADQDAQTKQVQTLLNSGCRRFVIQPVDAGQTEELLQLLQQAGAKVVFINTQPENLAQYPDFSYVGFDGAQAGQLQAQLLSDIDHLADHNGDGRLSYAVLEAQENIAWQESCAAALENGECLQVQTGCVDQEDTRKQCSLLLSRYGKDLEVIFCADDVQAAGALAAVEDGGRIVGEDIILISANATEQTLKLVEQGKLTGTLAADTALASAWVLQLLQDEGQVLSLTAYSAVSSGNYDDYVQWANQYGE